MSNRWLPLLAIAALGLTLAAACSDSKSSTPRGTATKSSATSGRTLPPSTSTAGDLSLTSSAFSDNGPIPAKYTCDGDNISPPLTIAGVPDRALTLALTVVDIDGPGGAFVHWVAWNIDTSTRDVPEGTVPDSAVEGKTGRGGPGYFGPCPPSGTHRYVFTLYALDVDLAIDPQLNSAPEIETASQGHTVARTQLTGTYAR